MFYENRAPAPLDASLFVDPINQVLVMWVGHPGPGGPDVGVTRRVLPVIDPETLESILRQLPEGEVRAFTDFLRQEGLLMARGEPKEKLIMFFARGLDEEERSTVLKAFIDLFAELGEAIEPEVRIVPREQLDEALAEFGVIEC
jgi:hypothetical protein